MGHFPHHLFSFFLFFFFSSSSSHFLPFCADPIPPLFAFFPIHSRLFSMLRRARPWPAASRNQCVCQVVNGFCFFFFFFLHNRDIAILGGARVRAGKLYNHSARLTPCTAPARPSSRSFLFLPSNNKGFKPGLWIFPQLLLLSFLFVYFFVLFARRCGRCGRCWPCWPWRRRRRWWSGTPASA